MARSLFISDLHLDASRPAVIQALEAFLQKASDAEALYVLGDLFEAWLGDDDDSPLAQQITAMFHQFSASGPRLFLMQGNRDFLLGDNFCNAAGASLLPDPTVIDLHGTPTLLMHGDSLCTADEEYQSFRKMARDPAWQAELLSKSLEERRAIAQHLRTVSKDAGSNKAEDIMDVSPDTVELELKSRNVAQLIHGHTHRPATHHEVAGERWVLGDWDTLGWYIEARDGNLELIKFNINQ
ncbi:MAG: UDP-2,3-diacylglucosamine diphosphatase [Halieaceae bacterium]